MVPKHGPVQAVGYIEVGAKQKTKDTQSDSPEQLANDTCHRHIFKSLYSTVQSVEYPDPTTSGLS